MAMLMGGLHKAYEHFDQYVYNASPYQRGYQVKSMAIYFQTLWVRMTSLSENRMPQGDTGSQDKFGQDRWKRFETAHIGVFHPKRLRTA